MEDKIWLQWNNDSLVWGSNDYIWSQVYIVIQVAAAFGGGGGLALPKENPWNEIEKKLKELRFPEKKKQTFLEVVARVNGLVTKETKTLEDVKKSVSVDHIRKTFETFGQKVEVKVKNVKR